MANAEKQTLDFQTEVKQLLHIVIHSLYSNKEIFLRELISNASDAVDRLRFESVSNAALYEGDTDFYVKIDVDKEQNLIIIEDNGIGMSRTEVVENLGTIAKSGTKEFLQSLTGNEAKDTRLIGQFGVGFYSAFIVAEKVIVETRRAGLPPDQGVRWESTGEGAYTLENINKPQRGTKVMLFLRKDENEFLDPWRLKQIIHKYSDHIPLQVRMKAENLEDQPEADKYETVNRATALWTLPKSAIKDEDYKEFYKHIAHDFEDPMLWTHNKVEGKQQYTTLLYIPAHAPFDLWMREQSHGLKLYVQRVFIMDNAEQFLPHYLRFVKGVIDSSDLPLNISRELLQHNRLVESMRAVIIKRVLSMLEQLVTEDPSAYAKFWSEFGLALKEGPSEDMVNRERIAKLLRFASTHENLSEQTVSLDDYLSRIKPGQDKIYYITADSYNTASHSPHLEVFRKKGIEVLLLTDRIDEWLVAHLPEYQGKALQSVTRGELKLDEAEDDKSKEDHKKLEERYADLAKHIGEVLMDKVKEVRVSTRLIESPACIVSDENDLGSHMQRILKAAGQIVPLAKPVLEFNPEHPILKSLKDAPEDQFKEVSFFLLEQAILAEGGQLDDPATFINRVNKLLLQSRLFS